VRLDRVRALVLERIGANLVYDSNAAALLLLIDNCAAAFRVDHLHRLMQLRPAVTLGGTENVTGQALRMDTHERGNVAPHLAFEKSDKLLIAGERAITGNFKLTPFGGQSSNCDALNR